MAASWWVVCIALRGLLCSGFLIHTHETTMPQKLTRAQIKAGLDQVPIETLLSSGEGKQPKITHKQREFARAIALGQSKAAAYRGSHKANATKRTMNTEPYKLARDPRITREIEAYTLALEAEKHRTPAQLKALLVQQLVEHSLNEDFPPAQRMKALALIGQLYEVGAFLEQRQTTVIHKSADIRTRLLERLQTRSHTEPASDALELLQEIREGAAVSVGDVSAPTGGAPAHEGLTAASAHTHTVPLIQTLEKNDGGVVSENSNPVLDFDKE
jgi:hypothetical protein